MVNINIYNNNFKNNSSAVRNVYEGSENVDFARIDEELRSIKKGLKEESQEYKAVESIEKLSRKHDIKGIASIIKDLSIQFSGSALANIIGAYLCSYFKI